MTRSRFRRRGRALVALAMAAAVAARAQPAAAPEAVCRAAPALLEVSVGSASRGTYPVVRVDDQFWVPADALTESEAGYVAQTVTCDGTSYQRLSATLRVTFDDQEQSLNVRPAPQLLAGHVLDFSMTPAEVPLPQQPLITAGVHVQVSGQPAPAAGVPAYQQTATVSGRYALQRWDLGVGVTERSAAGNRVSVDGQARVAYRFSSGWHIQALLAGTLLDGGSPPLATDATFSGVVITGQSARGIVLPAFTLYLPLDSDVTLAIDDRVLRQFTVTAGTLVVRNLPVPTQQGELLVFITDLSGRRRQVIPFQNLSETLGRNAYQVYARAGVSAGQRTADLSAYYGLGSHLVLRALGTVQGAGVPTASLAALYSTPVGQFRAGVGVQAATDDPARPEMVATVGYGLAAGGWTLGVDASVPPAVPAHTALQASAGYTSERFSLGIGAAYDVSSGAPTVTGSVQGQVTPTLQLSGTVSAVQAGWRAGVGVVWTPTDRLSAAASVRSSLPATAGTMEPTVNVTYQATPTLGVWVGADRAGVTAGARYLGPVSADVQVNSDRSFAVDVTAGAVLVQGHVVAAPPAGGAGLLVRTGVPGVALRLNGARTQVTDRRGDALFTGVQPGEPAQVTVDFDTLELSTQVVDDTRSVSIGGDGLSVLDWTKNFRRVQWIQVFWADGTPAAYATITGLPGERVNPGTDDQGNALITRPEQTQRVTVTGEDGRACVVTVTPATDTVTCPAVP